MTKAFAQGAGAANYGRPQIGSTARSPSQRTWGWYIASSLNPSTPHRGKLMDGEPHSRIPWSFCNLPNNSSEASSCNRKKTNRQRSDRKARFQASVKRPFGRYAAYWPFGPRLRHPCAGFGRAGRQASPNEEQDAANWGFSWTVDDIGRQQRSLFRQTLMEVLLRRRAKAYARGGLAAKPFGRGGRTSGTTPAGTVCSDRRAGLREFRSCPAIPCALAFAGKRRGLLSWTPSLPTRSDGFLQIGRKFARGISAELPEY